MWISEGMSSRNGGAEVGFMVQKDHKLYLLVLRQLVPVRRIGGSANMSWVISPECKG